MRQHTNLFGEFQQLPYSDFELLHLTPREGQYRIVIEESLLGGGYASRQKFSGGRWRVVGSGLVYENLNEFVYETGIVRGEPGIVGQLKARTAWDEI